MFIKRVKLLIDQACRPETLLVHATCISIFIPLTCEATHCERRDTSGLPLTHERTGKKGDLTYVYLSSQARDAPGACAPATHYERRDISGLPLTQERASKRGFHVRVFKHSGQRCPWGMREVRDNTL